MDIKHITTLVTALFAACMQCLAQPSAVKDAAKSVFKLTTYKADGTVLAETNGILADGEGTAISALKPFLGAARATVTDSRGRQSEVIRMLGANELYNMAKFKVGETKMKPLHFAAAPLKQGGVAWIVSLVNGKTDITEAKIRSVETFMDKYAYYILDADVADGNQEQSILISPDGEALALTKRATATAAMHATDANFATSLTTNGFALSDPVLSQIGIPPSLPDKQDQALLVLIMAGQSPDSVKRRAIAADFIAKYPTLADGYTSLARMQAAEGQYEEAAGTMQEAIKQTEKKDEAHAAYGKMIYDVAVYADTTVYAPWTLDLAAKETAEAYAANPLPTYRHQQAQITFAKGRYQEAYDEFTALLGTSIRNPELFYEASRCKAMMNAPQSEIIALLDSAINTTDTLRLREAAPYFLARAEAYEADSSYRQAVFDYTRYEILSATRPGADFYYVRARAEIKARLYQQALADMAAAITLAPGQPTYYAEMASLQLRVNLADDALKTASRCVEIAPDYPEGYLLLGLAQIAKDDKPGGLANLKKADELGNTQAKQFIEKYSNQ